MPTVAYKTNNRLTAEEIEVRVWAFVIVTLVSILLGAMAMFLYSVTFVQQPMSGMAADIEIPGVANADLAQFIMDNLEYTQLILEFYTPGIPDSGWVHVSYDPNNLKKQELTATKVAGKTTYLNGLVA